MCAVVIIGQNYDALTGHADATALLASYIGLPIFLSLWLGHKLVTGSRPVRLEEADLSRP